MPRAREAFRPFGLNKCRGRRIYFPRHMQISNRQLELLLPVVREKIEEAPEEIEWRVLYDRLVKMQEWRLRDYGPPSEAPSKVWGRDYV